LYVPSNLSHATLSQEETIETTVTSTKPTGQPAKTGQTLRTSAQTDSTASASQAKQPQAGKHAGQTGKQKEDGARIVEKVTTTTVTTTTHNKHSKPIPPPLAKPPLAKPIPPPLARPIPPPLAKQPSKQPSRIPPPLVRKSSTLTWKQTLTREWTNFLVLVKTLWPKLNKTLLASILTGLIALLLLSSSWKSVGKEERHYTIVVKEFEGSFKVDLPAVNNVGQVLTIVKDKETRETRDTESALEKVLEKLGDVEKRIEEIDEQVVVEIVPVQSVQHEQSATQYVEHSHSEGMSHEAKQEDMRASEEIPEDVSSLVTPIASQSSPTYAFLANGPLSRFFSRVMSRKLRRPWGLLDSGSIDALLKGGRWVTKGTLGCLRLT